MCISRSNREQCGKQLFHKAVHRPDGSCYENRSTRQPKVVAVSGNGAWRSPEGSISESIDPGGNLCREPGALSKPGPGSGWRAATGSGVLGDRGGAEPAASGCPKVEVRGWQVGAGPTRARSGDA